MEESQLRRFPHRDHERLTAQLTFDIVELYVGTERRLELTCLSTIPGSLGPEQSEYADRQMSSVEGTVPRGMHDTLDQIIEAWQSCILIWYLTESTGNLR